MWLTRKGFTLVEIMISVNLVRSKAIAMEANAQTTLKTISTAMESYAGANEGMYSAGSDLSVLHDTDPKYINKDYVTDCTVDSPCQGYSYSCELVTSGYTCTATPDVVYGDARTYQIESGGSLTVVE